MKVESSKSTAMFLKTVPGLGMDPGALHVLDNHAISAFYPRGQLYWFLVIIEKNSGAFCFVNFLETGFLCSPSCPRTGSVDWSQT